MEELRQRTDDPILIARIREMEEHYHDVAHVMSNLNKSIEEYNGVKEEIAILKDYVESGQWLKDFEADESGQVPSDLKREVLSEDALYNLIEDACQIIAFAKSSLNNR